MRTIDIRAGGRRDRHLVLGQHAADRHAAASGQLVANSGAGAKAYVTREVCAAVAAAVLTQDGHQNQVYDVTGPRAWSAADLAALAGKIGDREIKLVQVDDEAYRDGLVRAGFRLPSPDSSPRSARRPAAVSSPTSARPSST